MPEKQIKELYKRIEDLECRISKIEENTKINRKNTPKKTSIKEFIRDLKPSNDVEKTLIIGYYLEKFEEMECFNVNDMKKSFKDAREKMPKNVADKFQLNIKKGHFMDYGDKDGLKSYILTNSGETYVKEIMGENYGR